MDGRFRFALYKLRHRVHPDVWPCTADPHNLGRTWFACECGGSWYEGEKPQHLPLQNVPLEIPLDNHGWPL